jgi:hypothetical protein
MYVIRWLGDASPAPYYYKEGIGKKSILTGRALDTCWVHDITEATVLPKTDIERILHVWNVPYGSRLLVVPSPNKED